MSILFILILPFISKAEPLPELIGTIRCDTVNTLFGWRIVPLGDQNNDGYDDFLTWDFRFRTFVYFGGDPIDTVPDLVFDNVNGRINNLGDVSGDGFDDFTMQGRSPYKWKMGVYYGGPSLDTIRDAWFGEDSLHGVGFSISGDDLNMNGTNEIVTWGNDGSSVLFYELDPIQDSIHNLRIFPANVTGSFRFGENIAAGDFNGDGKRDLAVSLQFAGALKKRGSVYLYWGGASFDTIPDMIISRPGFWFSGAGEFGRILEFLGDFNGDGYDDMIVGGGVAFDDTLNFVYFGGPSIDTIPDIVISRRLDKARLAGDLNGDGHNDLIVSYPLPFSGAGDVRIYYGGPGVDSIPDIVIRNNDMPGLQFELGMDCSGVGDVNGDGIDDFAFSALEGVTGVIYIFSGTGMPTGIEIEYEPTLPANYELSQNYPNPFNPTTTIQFSLPIRNHVALKVFNVTGAEVAVLINKTLSAGEYKVTWDGRDSEGNEVASGVYFYKLETEEFVDSKKMVLVR